MNNEGKLKCRAFYDETYRILIVHFNRELNMNNVPVEQNMGNVPVEQKRKGDFRNDCCGNDNLFSDDDCEDDCEIKTERLLMFLLKTEGVDSVPEIKKYSLAVEVGLFSDPFEVAGRIVDLIVCLVFSGEEAEIISEKSKKQRSREKKKK